MLILAGIAAFIIWHRALRAEMRRTFGDPGGGGGGSGRESDSDGDGGGDGGGGD